MTKVVTLLSDLNPSTRDLLRLQAWLSPAFPTGGFSYSHGLEEAVMRGDLGTADGLFKWAEAAVSFGCGRVDAMLLVEAWRAVAAGEQERLFKVAEIGAAMRGTTELAIESVSQGEAFINTVQLAWPEVLMGSDIEKLLSSGINLALPVSVGIITASHEVSLEAVIPMYLQSFGVGIVSAGVRLIPLGQTDGQRVTARLQPVVERASIAVLSASFEDIGGAAPIIDLASMTHEVRNGRLFRS